MSDPLRFIVMHRTTPHWESGARPGPELIARVGEYIGALARAGALIAAEGLRASAEGARIRLRGGRRTVTRGPLAPENELPKGFVLVKTRSLDEAVDWGARYAEAAGAEGVDVRPLSEPWDFGFAPPPAEPARRYMLLQHADSESEAGRRRPDWLRQRREKLLGEMETAGVLLGRVELQPSAQGRRYAAAANGPAPVVDGPFAESKELIAGYVMFRAPSLEDAHPWALRYGEAAGAHAWDLRVVDDEETPG